MACDGVFCTCDQCVLRSLPFNHLTENNTYTDALSQFFNFTPVNNLMDLEALNAMNFEIFDVDHDEAINELNEIDPDLHYYNEFVHANTCTYFSEDSFNQKFSSCTNGSSAFSVLHSNIRSFHANYRDLHALLANLDFRFSVICFIGNLAE